MSDETQRHPTETAQVLRPAVELVTPPHSIRLKAIRKVGSPEAMFAEIEANFATMKRDYENWAARDLERMREALAEIGTDFTSPATDLGKLRGIAHDMKGQGSTFGYNLITDIAASLGRYLRDVPPDRRRSDVVVAHMDALDAVLSKRILGNGGAVGRAIVDALASVIALHCDVAPTTQPT